MNVKTKQGPRRAQYHWRSVRPRDVISEAWASIFCSAKWRKPWNLLHKVAVGVGCEKPNKVSGGDSDSVALKDCNLLSPLLLLGKTGGRMLNNVQAFTEIAPGKNSTTFSKNTLQFSWVFFITLNCAEKSHLIIYVFKKNWKPFKSPGFPPILTEFWSS